jgi:hypothetical protein
MTVWVTLCVACILDDHTILGGTCLLILALCAIRPSEPGGTVGESQVRALSG